MDSAAGVRPLTSLTPDPSGVSLNNAFFRSLSCAFLAAGLAAGIATVPAAVTAGAAVAAEPDTALTAETLAAPRLAKAAQTGLTLSWPDYPNAGKYEVRYGKRADFSDATIVERKESRYIGGLTNATTYYLQYRAVVPGTGKHAKYTRTAWSATLKARTLAAYPGPFSFITTEGGQDSITVAWSKTSNTTKYSVVVADNLAMTLRPRTFTGITETSFTVRNLTHGSRSSMPTFIRVYAHNKDFTTRESPRQTAYAAPPAVSGSETLTAASYNLLCAVCDGGGEAPAWSKRIPKIMNSIKSRQPDVLLLQEGLNVRIPGTNTLSMVNMRTRLKNSGYVLDRAPEKPGTAQYWNRIAYKENKYALLRKGSFTMPTPAGQRQRGAVWVQLKSRATGKKFYAVSYHIAPVLPLQGSNSRTSGMKRINAQMGKINAAGLPVVAGGDMNTHFYQLPSNTPHEAMIRAGWTDAGSSAAKTDFFYSTLNAYKKQQPQHLGRIDYIFTKNVRGTVSYENVLDVDSAGVLQSLPGSDHNMVLARMRLR
jgi:endonuclease/exonuclease/phosphatase family metal-dependent hydrolase